MKLKKKQLLQIHRVINLHFNLQFCYNSFILFSNIMYIIYIYYKIMLLC